MKTDTRFFHRQQQIDAATVRFILDEKRAEKLKRSTALRKEIKARRQAEADERAVRKAIRRMVREQEKERRAGIIVMAEPQPARYPKERDKAFEAMTGLRVPRLSRRGPDGHSSFHLKLRSRGFGERRRNRAHVFKPGETVRTMCYILREPAREIVGGGLVSNISDDVEELAGFCAALEEFERCDRANAQVYISAVLALPHELTSEQRLAALERVCAILARHGLVYIAVLHKPDPEGDQRNVHAHIMFSLRPVEVAGMGCYIFSAEKHSDLNDESFITPFRAEVAEILNEAMAAAGHERRFTGLSDADRGMAPRSKESGKSTVGQKAVERKERDLADMEAERGLRERFGEALARLSSAVTDVAKTLKRDLAADYALLRSEIARIGEQQPAPPASPEPAACPVSIDRPPSPPSIPEGWTPSRNTGRAIENRLDAARMALIDSLIARLSAVDSLPLMRTPANEAGSVANSPGRFDLAPVNARDHRAGLFAEVAPFADDPAVQAVFKAKYTDLLRRVFRDLTEREAPFVRTNELRLTELSAGPEYHQAVRLAAGDPTFGDMLAEAERASRKRERERLAAKRKRVEAIEQGRLTALSHAESVSDEQTRYRLLATIDHLASDMTAGLADMKHEGKHFGVVAMHPSLPVDVEAAAGTAIGLRAIQALGDAVHDHPIQRAWVATRTLAVSGVPIQSRSVAIPSLSRGGAERG